MPSISISSLQKRINRAAPLCRRRKEASKGKHNKIVGDKKVVKASLRKVFIRSAREFSFKANLSIKSVSSK
jgi:hypothetical protein